MKVMKQSYQSLYEVNTVKKLHAQCDKYHVLCFRDAKYVGNNIYLFTKYVNASEIFNIVDHNLVSLMPRRVVYDIMLQIAVAVKYLHDNHIVHLDIKLENILYKGGLKPSIILIDYGFACITELIDIGLRYCKSMTYAKGTVGYMSPELSILDPASITDFFKSDIYSLGVVFYLMLARSFPTVPESKMADYYYGKLNPPFFTVIPKINCDDKLKALLFEMLEMRYEKRCDINNVVKVLRGLAGGMPPK